jgi:hypothetical protein
MPYLMPFGARRITPDRAICVRPTGGRGRLGVRVADVLIGAFDRLDRGEQPAFRVRGLVNWSEDI